MTGRLRTIGCILTISLAARSAAGQTATRPLFVSAGQLDVASIMPGPPKAGSAEAAKRAKDLEAMEKELRKAISERAQWTPEALATNVGLSSGTNQPVMPASHVGSATHTDWKKRLISSLPIPGSVAR